MPRIAPPPQLMEPLHAPPGLPPDVRRRTPAHRVLAAAALASKLFGAATSVFFCRSTCRSSDMPGNDYGVLFPTSVVGSLPRPAYVKDLIADDYKGSPGDYRRHMENAIRSAVAMQEMAGLDVVTDGEWWRKSYIGVIAELAHGFELSRNPADGRPWTVVT
jgi:hypothetical protein